MVHIVLELAAQTIRVSGLRSLSFVILKLYQDSLLILLGLCTFKSVIRGPVGGPGNRSLLWFLPRFPAPILVRFFPGLQVTAAADARSNCLVLLEF